MRKVLPLWLVAILLCSGFSVGQVNMPEYASGHSWKYSANASYSGIVLSGTYETRLGGNESISIGPETYETVRIQILGNGSFSGVLDQYAVSGNWTLVTLEHWDTQSGETVQLQTTVVFRGTAVSGTTSNFTLSVHKTVRNTVVTDSWTYPYGVGDRGNVSLLRTSNETSLLDVGSSVPVYKSDDWSGHVNVSYSCLESSRMSVIAGTFDTYHILRIESGGIAEETHYSPDAGAGVLVHSSIGGVLVGDGQLVSFSFTEAKPPADEGLPLVLFVGAGALVVAVVAVFCVYERRRSS